MAIITSTASSDDRSNGGAGFDRIDGGEGSDALRSDVRVERLFGSGNHHAGAPDAAHCPYGSEGNDLAWGEPKIDG